jgi:uncharacterized membrane protein
MKYNMVWDGLFHAFTWVMVCLGIWRLWVAGKHRDVPWSGRTLLGALVCGWGSFNVIEGVIDHQILGVHHVRPGPGEVAWDLGFLAFGAIQLALGWGLIRAGHADDTPPGSVWPSSR